MTDAPAAPAPPERACPFCKAPFDVAALLSRARGYSRQTNSGVTSCPACDEVIEFRVHGRELELGYTYAAGSPHFEGMLSFRVSGLQMVREEGRASFVLQGQILSTVPFG